MLVEPACGAALAVLYSERLRDIYFPKGKQPPQGYGPIIIEICGGSGISIDLLQEWKTKFQL